MALEGITIHTSQQLRDQTPESACRNIEEAILRELDMQFSLRLDPLDPLPLNPVETDRFKMILKKIFPFFYPESYGRCRNVSDLALTLFGQIGAR